MPPYAICGSCPAFNRNELLVLPVRSQRFERVRPECLCEVACQPKLKSANFSRGSFPRIAASSKRWGGRNSATVIHRIGDDEVRPGGTVSGPVLMTVADVALYAALLGTIGIVPLAVTTSMTVNFLRRPSSDRCIVGECKLIKVGRTLAVGEVALYSQGDQAMVAHAAGTYSIPPSRSARH